ncbi:MAG TPA: response regulator [Chitinophagaceae bacterium]|nr:response regulator [Chitinophagaceae bacterium]
MQNREIEILLVEDNMDDAELAILALRKRNIANSLIHLDNGAEALDFLFGKGKYEGRNIANKPKIILLDLKMPKVDGFEVLKQIKANEETKAIPVVVLTSSKESPDVEQAYLLGANSYMVKPVEFDNFTQAVAEIGMYWLLYNHPPV